MGLLDSLFGGGKTKSQSEQKQESFGYSANRGSSTSTSGGSSSAVAGGVSGSSQSVFGADLFRQLYQGAFDAAGAINPAVVNQRVEQLFTGGVGIMEALAGGGAGEDYLTARLTGGNEALDAQIDALGSDLGRFLSNEVNPTLTGNAVAAGQLGGGRQGVAQGIATEGVLREFSTQAASLRANDIMQRDQAALGLMGAQTQRGATALSSLGALNELGTGVGALAPFEALSGIMGGPLALTESFGQEYSTEQSEQFAQAISEEFGISYDEAKALITSSSKGSQSGGIIPGIAGLLPGKG